MSNTLAAPSHTLDVRSMAPREHHSLILARFNALLPGQALELVNDHDPRPLRVQFEDRAFGTFEWSDLDTGPELWRVRICKSAGKAASDASESCCSGGACCG